MFLSTKHSSVVVEGTSSWTQKQRWSVAGHHHFHQYAHGHRFNHIHDLEQNCHTSFLNISSLSSSLLSSSSSSLSLLSKRFPLVQLRTAFAFPITGSFNLQYRHEIIINHHHHHHLSHHHHQRTRWCHYHHHHSSCNAVMKSSSLILSGFSSFSNLLLWWSWNSPYSSLLGTHHKWSWSSSHCLLFQSPWVTCRAAVQSQIPWTASPGFLQSLPGQA